MSTRFAPDAALLERACASYQTPFYLYDAAAIRAAARQLHDAFGWATGFVNYFAVKATPTPQILRLLADAGCGMDCSSLAELVLTQRLGLAGERVFFSSNNTPAAEFRLAHTIGAIINLDTPDLLADLVRAGALSQTICFRYNPGPLRAGNTIIGRPEEAKFGATRDQLLAGYARARDMGVRRFGLHTMLASNELDADYFIATAQMLFDLVGVVRAETGVVIDFVNLGGGIGIPYRPGEQPVDLGRVSAGVRAAYETQIVARGLAPVQLSLECGRMLTGPHGILVTRVRHIKATYRNYVGVDATMADLMRPGIYGAYHHISVPAKHDEMAEMVVDVVGSLCENNDKFAVQRALPVLEVGDLLVIHDAGAHGRAMGFNYNGKLRCAELLLREDGTIQQIRRAETLDDYFATISF